MKHIFLLLLALYHKSNAFLNHSKSKYTTNRSDVKSIFVGKRVPPQTMRLQAQSASSSSSLKEHTLVILKFPAKTSDTIANETLLFEAMRATKNKVSVVIRANDSSDDRLPTNLVTIQQLRKYLGDIYATAWDMAVEMLVDQSRSQLLDVVVYPVNLANCGNEGWLNLRPDLDCICSVDQMLGWFSVAPSENHNPFVNHERDGKGGLMSHVEAVNEDRASRGLSPVEGLSVKLPQICLEEEFQRENADNSIIKFMEDDSDNNLSVTAKGDDDNEGQLIGRLSHDDFMFNHVAVGGTFDDIHYGHRKLLTLAISSVTPQTGRLLIGITSDEMLKKKTLSNYILPVEKRIQNLKSFMSRVAPGFLNQISYTVLKDPLGPPVEDESFEALVLSHETLSNGLLLNKERERRNFKPLKLLCIRRDHYGMSSTSLRRIKANLEAQQPVTTQ